MTRSVLVPSARDVRGSLDEPDDSDGEAAVVACPPHPQHGGSKSDARLRAVGDALAARGVACLRFDYGEWDEGRGERTDALAAVDWASDRYDAVGLFGYSFGASVALLAAAEAADDVRAVSALAPGASLAGDADVAAAVERIRCPVQVLVGERDDTVDWEPVVRHAADAGHAVERLPADHFFVGRHDRVAKIVETFLVEALGQ
jgi:alpha/beta superfamily hydrolase